MIPIQNQINSVHMHTIADSV